jgi:ribonuclease T1
MVLVAALGIGYAVDYARGTGPASPTTSISAAPTTSTPAPVSATATVPAGAVPLSSLPQQAAATVHLIERGGPFPFSEDGEVFDNNEHDLPPEPLGYYHSYTVVTPGSPDRGTRRIVTGRAGQFWYTPDHYDTFVRVDVNA